MPKNEVKIRLLKEGDIGNATDLLLRLKKLNGEFDSIFNVADGAGKDAESQLKRMIGDKEKQLAYVAEKDGKLIGIIALNIINRSYYVPEIEARIVEFYIMPESRRTGAGKMLVDKVYSELKARNVKLITAEFPALNPIALSFYKQLGFREIIGVYGRVL